MDETPVKLPIRRFIFAILIKTALFLPIHGHCINLMGRLGVGGTSQLASGHPSISFKVQSKRESAWGGVLSLDSNSNNTNFGIGPKFYRLLFDEPHLNFYTALFASYLRENDKSGHQVDGTLGTEAHIPGIESLGIALDVGLSWNKVNDISRIETVGVLSLHFYL